MVKQSEDSTKTKPPRGWWLSGSKPEHYETGIDKTEYRSGTQCAYMKHCVDRPEEFGTIMQEMSPDEYLGKRLCMSGWLKTENVQSWASLWMSVYGSGGRLNVSFDNMCERKITGTTDWQKYAIVLDVPNESTKIGFGAILAGEGKLWLDDVEFEAVSNDLPISDCACSERRRPKTSPANLDFEEVH